eukprot:GHVR01055077.1.p1 GENE.GHVR01055077.1~~GHVR01055077.1.p1  ORF type:complete len:110 (-),score=15.52 GHVR01055077.1:292-621(-)
MQPQEELMDSKLMDVIHPVLMEYRMMIISGISPQTYLNLRTKIYLNLRIKTTELIQGPTTYQPEQQAMSQNKYKKQQRIEQILVSARQHTHHKHNKHHTVTNTNRKYTS